MSRIPTGTVVYGNALSCNGTSQYAIYGAGVATAATTNFTISCWVYINAYGAGDACPFCVGLPDANGYRFIYTNAGVFKVKYSTALTLTSGVTLSLATWYMITTRRSGTTTQNFVNGVAQGSTSSTAPFSPDSWATLGASKTSNPTVQEYSNAIIDDARYYSRALDDSEILDLYNQAITPSIKVNSSSLQLWWKCDESSGSLTDSSGHSYTATLSGSPTRSTGVVEISNTPARTVSATRTLGGLRSMAAN